MRPERKRHILWIVRIVVFWLSFAAAGVPVPAKTAERENRRSDPASETAVTAEEQELLSGLHAYCAVLMDGDSGRVLLEKEGNAARPMASTTKIMTCILALENGSGDDYVKVSANAAMQPEVRLGLQVGEQYYLEDLLYSLMLKSHNDTAVAIAETIGGSVEGFADMMNAKAREIGCKDTYFITPNGLDAEDENGVHHSTARDLCLMLRYAIQKKAYLKITSARSHTFHDLSGHRTFTVQNTNALLDMDEEVLTGKTGYTGNAGYCYVCACRSEGRTFLVALLACGWPHHKTWKWEDTQKLLKYAKETYFYRDLPEALPRLPKLPVINGADPDAGLWDRQQLALAYRIPDKFRKRRFLLKESDTLEWKTELPDLLTAPIEKESCIGTLSLLLNQKRLKQFPILAQKEIPKRSFPWVLRKLSELYFH